MGFLQRELTPSTDFPFQLGVCLGALRLDQTNGQPLADGDHILHLKALGEFGHQIIKEVSFTLDATLSLSLNLAEAFDPAPLGDRTTIITPVTLIGHTKRNLQVTLVQTGAMTMANANGDFSFPNVLLLDGSNPYTVTATDVAGRYAGRDFRLTDVYGQVIRDLLA